MTNHTEESLMQLFEDAINQVACRSGDDKVKAARLAIREVLDGFKSYKEASEFKAALVHELLPYQERAVKAEAEVARLLAERQGKINENPGHEYWLTASHDEMLDALRFQGAMTKSLLPYQDRVYSAEAECERNRKDAERYRWLRQRGQEQTFVLGVDWYEEELDVAIDAAMQEKQP